MSVRTAVVLLLTVLLAPILTLAVLLAIGRVWDGGSGSIDSEASAYLMVFTAFAVPGLIAGLVLTLVTWHHLPSPKRWLILLLGVAITTITSSGLFILLGSVTEFLPTIESQMLVVPMTLGTVGGVVLFALTQRRLKV